MPLRIGETFAGYRILRLLGSGGMGEVYLVQHPRLPRQDALKVLRPDVSSDTSFRERFIREADLAAGLRHPHIVGIHDRGEHDGQLWIAMDYIDGIDAAQLMSQRYPAGMPADLAMPIITAVARALDYAHKKGLLHRDVKPANIIVADLDSDDRSVFLADFGIARPLDDTSGITTTNMTVGTVAYAAPEQLMGEQMDGRADQYALAATMYHILTGLQLFPHSNPAVVISRHLNTTPPTVSERRPDCARFDDVLRIALAKNPSERFPSCSAFVQALVDESPGSRAAPANASTQSAPQSPSGRHRIRPTTRAAYEHALRPLRQRHGDLPVQKLTKADLDQLVSDVAIGHCSGQRRKWGANSINPMLDLISQVLGGLVKQGVLVRDVAARRSTLPLKRRASTTGPRSGSCRLPPSVGSGNSWRWADGSCDAESRCGRRGVRKADVVLDGYLASSGYRFPVVPQEPGLVNGSLVPTVSKAGRSLRRRD